MMKTERLEELKRKVLLVIKLYSVPKERYFDGFNRAEISIAVDELIKEGFIKFVKEDYNGMHYKVIKKIL